MFLVGNFWTWLYCAGICIARIFLGSSNEQYTAEKKFDHLSVDLFYKKGILFYSTKSLSIFAFNSEFKVKILKDHIRDQNLGSNLWLILKTMILGVLKFLEQYYFLTMCGSGICV